MCPESLVCDRHCCAHVAACATESDGCQNCCQSSCSIRFAVPCWWFHFVVPHVMRKEEGKRSAQIDRTWEESFFCVWNDDPVSSGCCARGGLAYVDQGCMCAGVHGVQVERRSGMRDPCFKVQCGSFTQRFLQVWRHLWNKQPLATMIFVRRSLYFALWLCTSGTSVNWASLSGDGAAPSGRYAHSMTALADGTAVLFGGYGLDGALFNDVYTLTVSGTRATWASLSSDGATPGGRYGHSMTALADGTAVLFGGTIVLRASTTCTP